MTKQYGAIKRLQMLFWLLRTKIVWRRARLIRFPLDLRGKRYIDPGAGLTTGIRWKPIPTGRAFYASGRTYN